MHTQTNYEIEIKFNNTKIPICLDCNRAQGEREKER